MNCIHGAKDLIEATFAAIEGETHFCDFAEHRNNDDCDSPHEIDTSCVLKNNKEIIGG